MNRSIVFAIALATALLSATGAYADTYGPRDDVQAPRGQEVQAPRGQEVQAPRGQEVQAPRADAHNESDTQTPRG